LDTIPPSVSAHVEYQGSKKVLVAAKEVIISGGVINTPHLLLHSGIGDRDQLNTLGIPTLVDNPSVGKNLSDQVAAFIAFSTNMTSTEYGCSSFAKLSNQYCCSYNVTEALEEWNKTQTGPLAISTNLNHIVWVRLNSTDNFPDPSAGENSPHIELWLSGISSQSPSGIGIPSLPPGNSIIAKKCPV
jgi:choline dehydrogenase